MDVIPHSRSPSLEIISEKKVQRSAPATPSTPNTVRRAPLANVFVGPGMPSSIRRSVESSASSRATRETGSLVQTDNSPQQQQRAPDEHNDNIKKRKSTASPSTSNKRQKPDDSPVNNPATPSETPIRPRNRVLWSLPSQNLYRSPNQMLSELTAAKKKTVLPSESEHLAQRDTTPSPTPMNRSVPASHQQSGSTSTSTSTPSATPSSQKAPRQAWTSAMYADLAQQAEDSFPFAAFAQKYSKSPREVREIFSAIITSPILRHSAQGLDKVRGRVGQQRVRDYKAAEKETAKVNKAEAQKEAREAKKARSAKSTQKTRESRKSKEEGEKSTKRTSKSKAGASQGKGT